MIGPSHASSVIRIAFQPIVDVAGRGRIFALEALARTICNGPRPEWKALAGSKEIMVFDHACRASALRSAVAAGIDVPISLNIGARSMCHPRFGALATLYEAERLGWPADRLIFELTEEAPITDIDEFEAAIRQLQSRGVRWAIDDLGSGYCRLGLISRLRPDIIKLDLSLTKAIEWNLDAQKFTRLLVKSCSRLGVELVCEGVETSRQLRLLREVGVRLLQGNHLAIPRFLKNRHKNE